MAKRSASTMADQVASLAAQRSSEPPAFESAAGRRRGPRKKGGDGPPADPSQPALIHTTVSLSPDLRRYLRREANRRLDDGEASRPDSSRVLRDYLDYIRDHQDDVDRWIRRRSG